MFEGVLSGSKTTSGGPATVAMSCGATRSGAVRLLAPSSSLLLIQGNGPSHEEGVRFNPSRSTSIEPAVIYTFSGKWLCDMSAQVL